MQETNNLTQNPPLQQTAVRRSAFDEVRKWENDQLRTLLKEVKEMGELDAPRHFKQSDKMKQLFELEKADYYTWADQFSNVQRAIEVEILWRVRTDAW
jgi:transposase